MDKKYLMNRYAHYYDYLQTLGKIPLTTTAVIEHLNPSRGLLQSCYKEIKEQKFNGNLIEYLCWISSLYLIDRAGNEDIAEYLSNNFESLKEDANNLLRLCSRRPELFGGSKELLLMWLKNYMNEIKSTS